MHEEIPNNYTKEYNEAIIKINQLKKQLEAVYSRCEQICKGAKTSWFHTTAPKMADHCAHLIRSERMRMGYSSEIPYRHLSEIVDIRDYKKKRARGR